VFEWDPQKAIANFHKHGVSFEEAATLFSDPDALSGGNEEHAEREPRFKRLGRTAIGRIDIVVYTIRRSPDGQESVHIVHARQASRKERQAYFGR